MSDIFALNFDGLSSPSIKLRLSEAQNAPSTGWGFGWYPHNNQGAIVAKDPAARDTRILTEALMDWEKFRSTVFICKVMKSGKGYTNHETQPFSRSFAGRDWLFMHKGDLDKNKLQALHSNKSRFLEPLGRTDSEIAFCYLLGLMQDSNIRKLADINPEILLVWFEQFDQLGSADMILSDGNTIICYHGTQSPSSMYYTRRKPPNKIDTFNSDIALIELKDPRDTYRTALIFSSSPFPQGEWRQMEAGQLLIARRGNIVWDSKKGLITPNKADSPLISPQENFNTAKTTNLSPSTKIALAQLPDLSITNYRAMTHSPDGQILSYRLFDVTHITNYEYERIVEHSTHKFRLQPVEDQLQEVILSSLKVSTAGEEIRFEDVFGNQSVHYSIDAPYTNLSIESKSRVKVFARPPDDHTLSQRKTTIPLLWMPWQKQMMMAYLLPPELPETQLVELTDYAMSFVERNDYSLHQTLEDINQSIYNDYRYVQGTTSLNTTPFEVYAAREGVCQDFANLFICLARLLNIPARYRMGYIYTGANYDNKLQSEASHAWAEVYLPYVGWRGYDPTNGCTVAQDHVRVACGRNYRDATPTSGTIFKGGGAEKLSVTVRIEEVNL